jgi:hypothetical protein
MGGILFFQRDQSQITQPPPLVADCRCAIETAKEQENQACGARAGELSPPDGRHYVVDAPDFEIARGF